VLALATASSFQGAARLRGAGGAHGLAAGTRGNAAIFAMAVRKCHGLRILISMWRSFLTDLFSPKYVDNSVEKWHLSISAK
jgi:hypothetical protein